MIEAGTSRLYHSFYCIIQIQYGWKSQDVMESHDVETRHDVKTTHVLSLHGRISPDLGRNDVLESNR